MQRVYALPIAQNDTKTFNPVFVTVSVQGCLTEADAALINNPSFDTPQTTGWLGRMWERFEAAPDDDPTHWKAKLRKTVAPKTDTQHLLLHTTATDHVVVEIAHPTTLGPSAIQRLIHEITDKPEAIAVFAGLLPLSVAGAAVIPIFGKFVLASNLYHLFDSTKAVKGKEALQALIAAGRVHFVCDPQLDEFYTTCSNTGGWEAVRSDVVLRPVTVLTDGAIAQLAALVGGPSGPHVGLVGSAANLLYRAKAALLGRASVKDNSVVLGSLPAGVHAQPRSVTGTSVLAGLHADKSLTGTSVPAGVSQQQQDGATNDTQKKHNNQENQE